ncbi:MAG: hypothetical protein DHS20C16_06470 [Phycisphaerae bacterium]|nr:MAG: hypothetical protein DHS20C16_06470 [Phycisphaerae bacterium]
MIITGCTAAVTPTTEEQARVTCEHEETAYHAKSEISELKKLADELKRKNSASKEAAAEQ